MGSWFSSIFKLEESLSSKQLSNTVEAPVLQDPLLLLSAAAKIAALHRSMEARSSQANSSLLGSPEFDTSHDFDTDVVSYIVYLTLTKLRYDILCRCGGQPSTSIGWLIRERELSRWRCRGSDAVPAGIKTSVINSFLPNCRRIVDRLRTKSFCCQFVKGGSELVVASQDECIRFFQQRGRRDKYTKIKTIQVCYVIQRVVISIYCFTYNKINFKWLSDPSIDNPDGVTWNELVIPNIDAFQFYYFHFFVTKLKYN
uniref:Uncharacterized protein n=1 Tax=Heterorhabditis bacteriophora TaxID=37862 RepID=A0A1I7WZC2_HETBA